MADIVTLAERLKMRIPDMQNTNAKALQEIVTGAREYVLSYTNRKKTDAALDECILRLSVIAINRQGIEGEASHAEGSISRSVDMLPSDIKAILNMRRVLKV
jgi:hypothetical protein